MEKLRIESRTSIRPIVQPEIIRPSTPLFFFKNTGNTVMYINNDPFQPGEIFGIDNSTFVALAIMFGKNLDISEATNYDIRFGSTVVDFGVFPGLFAAVPRGQASLYTTEYYKVN